MTKRRTKGDGGITRRDEPPTGPILHALASVYADHPDYRQEWKP